MLGRIRPVRLSGPGIPPRRVALLIVYLPCPSCRRPSRVPALNDPSRTNPPEYGPFIGTGPRAIGPMRRSTSMLLGGFAQIGDLPRRGQASSASTASTSADRRLGAAGEEGRGRRPVRLGSRAEAVVVDQRHPPRIGLPELHRRRDHPVIDEGAEVVPHLGLDLLGDQGPVRAGDQHAGDRSAAPRR